MIRKTVHTNYHVFSFVIELVQLLSYIVLGVKKKA